MIQTLYFIGTVAAVLACSALAACCFCRCCAKVLRGADWTAKKYGSSYIVSVQSGAELVSALDDFAKAEKLTLGSVSGIGAAEIVVSAIRCGKLERSFDEKTGLNLYDFSK